MWQHSTATYGGKLSGKKLAEKVVEFAVVLRYDLHVSTPTYLERTLVFLPYPFPTPALMSSRHLGGTWE